MPRYHVKIGDRDYDVELSSVGETNSIRVNGREVRVVSHRLSDNRTLLSVDNKTTEIDIHPDGNGSKLIFMRGLELQASIEDYNLAQIRKTAGLSDEKSVEKVLKAAMPGLIVDVRVKPGDKVTNGTPLVVVEAMKMENIIKAKGEAVVKEVMVRRGMAVDKGDKLLEFE